MANFEKEVAKAVIFMVAVAGFVGFMIEVGLKNWR